jgi:hypothetical protein
VIVAATGLVDRGCAIGAGRGCHHGRATRNDRRPVSRRVGVVRRSLGAWLRRGGPAMWITNVQSVAADRTSRTTLRASKALWIVGIAVRWHRILALCAT